MKAALVERFKNVIQEGSRENVRTDTDSGAYRQLFLRGAEKYGKYVF